MPMAGGEDQCFSYFRRRTDGSLLYGGRLGTINCSRDCDNLCLGPWYSKCSLVTSLDAQEKSGTVIWLGISCVPG